MIGELIQQERSTEIAAVVNVKREIQLADGKLDRLADLLIEGTLDREMYAARRENLLMRKRELNDRISTTEDAFWTSVSKMFELGNTAYLQYVTADDDKKREILFSACSNFHCNEKNVGFTLRFPFEQLRNYRTSNNGGPSTGDLRKGDISSEDRNMRQEHLKEFLLTLRSVKYEQ